MLDTGHVGRKIIIDDGTQKRKVREMDANGDLVIHAAPTTEQCERELKERIAKIPKAQRERNKSELRDLISKLAATKAIS